MKKRNCNLPRNRYRVDAIRRGDRIEGRGARVTRGAARTKEGNRLATDGVAHRHEPAQCAAAATAASAALAGAGVRVRIQTGGGAARRRVEDDRAPRDRRWVWEDVYLVKVSSPEKISVFPSIKVISVIKI